MEYRLWDFWRYGWRTRWTDRSMFGFREAKTMPVQQIVVNPVTLQQTNNKDRKVSYYISKNILELKSIL